MWCQAAGCPTHSNTFLQDFGFWHLASTLRWFCRISLGFDLCPSYKKTKWWVYCIFYLFFSISGFILISIIFEYLLCWPWQDFFCSKSEWKLVASIYDCLWNWWVSNNYFFIYKYNANLNSMDLKSLQIWNFCWIDLLQLSNNV